VTTYGGGACAVHSSHPLGDDGAYPAAALVLGNNGKRYGATPVGGGSGGSRYWGAVGCGTADGHRLRRRPNRQRSSRNHSKIILARKANSTGNSFTSSSTRSRTMRLRK
jgi:hypothetical protein